MKSAGLSKNIFVYICIVFCVFVFIFTHLFRLGSVPKGLQSDEASFLMNSYSLLVTHKDEDGRTYPVWFDSLIDAKPALYSYLQLPFIALLGPTTTASRIPAAIFGAISIPLAYWVLTFIIQKKHALLVTVFLIISPWHIIVARSTQEVIVGFVFSLLAIGAYFSVFSSTKKKLIWASIFILANALAMYSYHSTKVFLPLLFLGWSIGSIVFFPPKKEHSVWWLHFWLITSLFVVALIITFSFPQSLERFKAIGFLHEKGPLLLAEEQMRTATGVSPGFVLRIFYNKVVMYGLRILQTYGEHFTIDFLFLTGGEPGRYAIPFQGMLYHIELFLLPVGIFLGLHNPKNLRWAVYMLWWLIVAPLPAALTALEIPSMIRTFPMVIPLLVFITHALLWIWNKKKSMYAQVALVIICLGYVWGISYYFQQLFVQQPRYHPWTRNTAEEKLAPWLVEHAADYDRVAILTLRDVYMYLILADPTLLSTVQHSYPARKKDDFVLGKYLFHESECAIPVYPNDQKVLYVVRATCEMQPGYTVLQRFGYDDNAAVYNVIEVHQIEERSHASKK